MTKLKAPSRLGTLKESLTVLEFPKWLFNGLDVARQPRGHGEPVIVFPGFGADDLSTLPLRRYLNAIGYKTSGWGLGPNLGNVPELIPQVADIAADMADKSGQPVNLIGWSLGGYLAREAARERGDCVNQVITMGSPIVGGPKYSVVADLYKLQGADMDEIEIEVKKREQVPLSVPVTAIYSKLDGIVAWQACVDRVHSNTDNIEVSATHLGLGVSSEVYRIIARKLNEHRMPQAA
ncbi:MAG: alpha/beta hydrolase [Pseudomonadota bacterium]